MNIQRPHISTETILQACTVVALKLDGTAEEIASCYYSHIDGYQLAKELEDKHSWNIDLQVIEELEELQWEVDSIHKKVCMQWVIDSNIKPQFENGTKIKEGVINGVYKHGAAAYMVTKYGETMHGRHTIIKFEDAVEL